MTSPHENEVKKKWDAMSLKEKWNASRHQRFYDPKVTVCSQAAANTMFLFLSTTLLYVTLNYTTQDYYSSQGSWTVYYMNVLHVFIYCNIMANWICVKCYHSKYRQTEDTPNTDNTTEENDRTKKDHAVEMEMQVNPQGGGELLPMVRWRGKKLTTWTFCEKCKVSVPPRAHHCNVCRVCILKRDHHCFLLGTCIGHWNQRYFVMLSIYCCIGSTYGLYLVHSYLKNHFYPSCSTYDLLLPISLARTVPSHTKKNLVL